MWVNPLWRAISSIIGRNLYMPNSGNHLLIILLIQNQNPLIDKQKI